MRRKLLNALIWAIWLILIEALLLGWNLSKFKDAFPPLDGKHVRDGKQLSP